MTDPATPSPPPPPSPRVERPLATLILSLALFALPVVGLTLGRKLFDQETRTTDTATAVVTGAVLCVGAWLLYSAIRGFRRLAARRAPAPPAHDVHSPGLIRAILAEHDLPCPRCGYNLRGLAEPACPECHEPVRLQIAGRGHGGPTTFLIGLATTTVGLHTITTGFSVWSITRSILSYYSYAGMNYSLWQLLPYVARASVDVVGITVLTSAFIAIRRANDRERRALLRWRILRTCVWLVVIDGLLTLSLWTWTVFGRW